MEPVEPLYLFGRLSGEGEFVDLTDAELDAVGGPLEELLDNFEEVINEDEDDEFS